MRKLILRTVPLILAAATLVSAAARAEDGVRHDFKLRWNKDFIKLLGPSPQGEDCDQTSQRLADCVRDKIEEYQKNPEVLGDCTLGPDRCAYESCVDSLEIGRLACGFIQKDSAISNNLTRWNDETSKTYDAEPQPALSCDEELAALKDKVSRLECALACSKKSGLARLECSVRCTSLAIRENTSRWE